MAEGDKQLNKEIKELNKHLKELKNSGRHMIYSANAFKFAVYNFIAGIFHSLGALVGYVIIFGIIAYLVSRSGFSNMMSKWVEKTLKGVDWNNIMPMPDTNNLEQLQEQLPQNLDQETIQQLQQQLGQ